MVDLARVRRLSERFLRYVSPSERAYAAYLFNDTDSHISFDGTPPVAAAPFSWACWFSKGGTTNDTLLWIGDKDAASAYWALRCTSGGTLVQRANAAGSADAASVNTYATNTWQHAAGIETSATDRRAILNGDWANSGTNATSKAPAGADRIALGALRNSAPTEWLGGYLGEVAIWAVALEQDEVEALAAGISPLLIRPQSLSFYMPLISDLNELDSGFVLTNVNAVDANDHMRIFYPSRSQLGRGSAAAAPPSLTSISPTTGPSAGGTAFTLTGTDFVSGATVKFDGVNATSVVFVNSTSITGVTPAGAGLADVLVTNPDAQTDTLANGFTYLGPPVVEQANSAAGFAVLDVDIGTAPVAGNHVFRAIMSKAASAEITKPTGYTEISRLADAVSLNVLAAALKEAGVAEPETAAWLHTGSETHAVGALEISGADLAAPVQAQNSSGWLGSGTSISSGIATADGGDILAVAVFGLQAHAVTPSVNNGFTIIENAVGGNAASGPNLIIATKEIAAAGAVECLLSFSNSVARRGGMIFLFQASNESVALASAITMALTVTASLNALPNPSFRIRVEPVYIPARVFLHDGNGRRLEQLLDAI